jgi:hypothetical protein
MKRIETPFCYVRKVFSTKGFSSRERGGRRAVSFLRRKAKNLS